MAKKAGAAGIVLGLLTPEKQIDEKNTRLLSEYASPLPVTFHKAIDELADLVAGIRTLKKIPQIKRVLTSGGQKTALEGQLKLREMINEAGDQLIILVAGKVMDSNIEEIREATMAAEFHGRRIVGQLS